jgi:hypothetical protein
MQSTMSRTKTIMLFAISGPAVGTSAFALLIILIGFYQREAVAPQVSSIIPLEFLHALPMLFIPGYFIGLIPAGISGWLFSWLLERRARAVDQANSMAAMGLIAGFFTPLLAAIPMCLIANHNNPGMRMIDGVGIIALLLAFGGFSGAVCAILWYKLRATETKLPST